MVQILITCGMVLFVFLLGCWAFSPKRKLATEAEVRELVRIIMGVDLK